MRFGFWTGIGSAALAFLAYNFFFVDPVMTLRVASFEDVLALGVFLLVAGLSGSLAGRLREQATAAQERARLLEHLCDLSAALGSAATEPEAREATRQGLQRLTGSDAIFLDRGLSTNPPLAVDDMQAAERALRRGKVEAAAASGWSEEDDTISTPVIAGGDAPLVVGVAPGAASDEQEKAVRTAVEQAGAAIRRLRLADEADEARRKAERESIRAALLSSLSHDLKTPLATILGSVTTLRQFSATLPEAARTDLLRAIEEEARRLNIYVGNLLQMTRLQSGIDARLDWAELATSCRARWVGCGRCIPTEPWSWRPILISRWCGRMPSCWSRRCSIASTMRPPSRRREHRSASRSRCMKAASSSPSRTRPRRRSGRAGTHLRAFPARLGRRRQRNRPRPRHRQRHFARARRCDRRREPADREGRSALLAGGAEREGPRP